MRQEETGSWIKLHIDELHDLYSLPSIIWVNKLRRVEGSGMWNVWGGGGEGKKNAYIILVVKPQGKSPPTPLSLSKHNNAVIAAKWNSYLMISHMSHLCILKKTNMLHTFHQNFSIHFRSLQ
jgi:hypothetical protein